MDKTLLDKLHHGKATPAGPSILITEKLQPAEYRALDRLLNAAGGKWHRQAQAHVFPVGTDTAEAVEEALKAGLHIDPNPHDFYPTPAALAARLVHLSMDVEHILWRMAENPAWRLRILEPGAGQGGLLDALLEKLPRDRVEIMAFEIDPHNQAVLRDRGINLAGADFLKAPVTGMVDLALVNPPFDIPGCREGWAVHLSRAMEWLIPGGTLAAIAPGAGRTAHKTGAAVQLLAMANAAGNIENLGFHRFAAADGRSNGAYVQVHAIIVHKAENHDYRGRPHNGRTNKDTWATEMAIRNNDYRLLEGLEEQIGATRAGSLRRIHTLLQRQRSMWVAQGAPWIDGRVDSMELAEAVLENLREPPDDKTAMAKWLGLDDRTTAGSKQTMLAL
jgi:hypothetical protein